MYKWKLSYLMAEADEGSGGGGGDPGDKEEKVSKESESDADDDDEDDLDDDDRKEAVKLYKLLKDPTSSKRVVAAMAENLGFKFSEVKKDDDTRDEFIEALKKSLGEDYDYLAPRLGPAIKQLLSKHEEKINKRFEEMTKVQVQNEVDKALEKIQADKDFKKHEKTLNKLMKEMSPGEGQTPLQYLTRLYKLAKTEDNEMSETRRKQNANDARDRMRSSSRDQDDSRQNLSKKNNEPKSLRQIINEAASTLELETE